MNIYRFVVVLIVIVCGIGTQTVSAAAKAPPAGAIDGVIKDEQGNDLIRYAGLVPPHTAGHKTIGLILGLHGKGGDEKQQIGTISKALAALNLSEQYMILGLKSKNESWEDGDVPAVKQAIAWAIKEYPINPRRVSGLGFSSGAFFIGKFTTKHPDLICGGAVLSGGVFDAPKMEDESQPPAELYILHGEKDEMVAVKVAHDSCDRLDAGNYHYVYHELTGDGHGLSGPGGGLGRQDAVRFLTSLRNRVIPLTETEKKVIADLTAKLTEGKVNPPVATYLPLLDLAGPETDALIVLGFQSKKPEPRLYCATLCQQRIYGKLVLDALPGLLKDKDSKTRTAAIFALGLAANFKHDDAVVALNSLAKDTTAAIADRLNAAGQLGLTLSLQVNCVNQNKEIIRDLTNLQEDKNSKLKIIAQVGLDGKLTFNGQTYNKAEN